jgi:Xaa-Pro aminopeptidase
LPIQLKMIEPTLLDEGDIQWLNEYHVTCRDVIGPVLSEQGRTRAHAWLMRETQLLG